jgi:diguanylate cyclase (GGDEF)-like protein
MLDAVAKRLGDPAEGPPSRQTLPPWSLGFLCLVYFAAAKAGLRLAFLNESATPVWAPTGIALASLLVYGYGVWPAILLGAFLANLTTAGTVATCLGIAVGNTCEGLLGAYLVNRFADGARAFDRMQGVFKFAALAALTSTTVSATFGVVSLLLGGLLTRSNLGSVWLTWWLGDAVGALVFGPLLVLGLSAPAAGRHRARALETGALFLVVVIVSLIVFAGLSPSRTKTYPLEFLCFLPLLWAAFRIHQRGAALASVVLSGIAIWGTLHGFGPFVRDSVNESLLLLQAFLGVATLTALAVAAAVAEREGLEQKLLYLADHDPLTGVLSRRRFQTEVERELALALRYGSRGALFYLDLDRFKVINDELGHRAGDDVLVRFASLLKGRLRDTDLLARLGGDEFAILAPHADATTALALGAQLGEAIAQDRAAASPGRWVTASLGIALYPEHGLTVDELLSKADAAMYAAKRDGGNRSHMHAFDEHAATALKERLGEGARRRKPEPS